MIRNATSSQEDRTEALKIIDNWRASHAYPLHVFYMNLRRKIGSRNDILVAERLKRLESIVGKLQREDGMQLYRMQDLGGCRMVLPTLNEVYKFSEKFETSRIRHELKKRNDYTITTMPDRTSRNMMKTATPLSCTMRLLYGARTARGIQRLVSLTVPRASAISTRSTRASRCLTALTAAAA